MKRLTPALISSRFTCATRLAQDYASVADAVACYNATMAREWGQVQEALGRYNASVAQATAWCKDVEALMRRFRTQRSARWQESDEGEAYTAWEAAYAAPNLVPIALPSPDPLELPFDTDQGEELAGLPETP